jgi:hypothetical protein
MYLTCLLDKFSGGVARSCILNEMAVAFGDFAVLEQWKLIVDSLTITYKIRFVSSVHLFSFTLPELLDNLIFRMASAFFFFKIHHSRDYIHSAKKLFRGTWFSFDIGVLFRVNFLITVRSLKSRASQIMFSTMSKRQLWTTRCIQGQDKHIGMKGAMFQLNTEILL